MSPYRIVTSERAEQDLVEIWKHIAVDSSAIADRVVQKIERKARKLQDFPRIGWERDWISPGLRGLRCAPYIIFYRMDEDHRAINLVRILHMARDIEALFHDADHPGRLACGGDGEVTHRATALDAERPAC